MDAMNVAARYNPPMDAPCDPYVPPALAAITPMLDHAIRPALEALAETRHERLICTPPHRVVVTPRDKRWECGWRVLGDDDITLRVAVAVEDTAPTVLTGLIDGVAIGSYDTAGVDVMSGTFVEVIAAAVQRQVGMVAAHTSRATGRRANSWSGN